MPDLGNPNFYTTFKGRYELTPVEGVAQTDNQVVMLTAHNLICPCGDMALTGYEAGAVFATLPPECSPDRPIYATVPGVAGSLMPVIIEIGVDGGMKAVYPEGGVTEVRLSACAVSLNQSIYS